MTKRVAKIGLAIMTTLLALVVLWQFRIAVLYVLISLAVAAALRPLVNRLVGRRFLVRAAWILLYLAVLGGLGFVLFLTGKSSANEIQLLGKTVSVQNHWILPTWLEGTSLQQSIMAQLPSPNILFEAITGSQAQVALPALLGFTQGVASIVTAIIIILFLSLYWTLNQVHFERLWLSLLPSGLRKQARDIWRTIEPDLGSYIRSQAAHGLMVGLLLALGYWLLGSPYPISLALFGALASLIPMVGAALAVLPPLLVGLLTGWQLSFFTVLYTIVILIALGIWVKPRLFNRRWDNPILTLIILLAMASAFGLLGLILAPPLSAVCQILWSLLVSHRLAKGASAQISDLKERQQHLWDTIKAMDEPPQELVISSMERLTQLIQRAEPILQAALPVADQEADSFKPSSSPPSQATEDDPHSSITIRKKK